MRNIVVIFVTLLLMACSDSEQVSNEKSSPARAGKYVLDTHYKPVKEAINAENAGNTVTEFFGMVVLTVSNLNPLLMSGSYQNLKQ